MKHLLLLELNSVCEKESIETQIDILVKNFLNVIKNTPAFSEGQFILGESEQLIEILDRKQEIVEAIAGLKSRKVKTPKQQLALITEALNASVTSALIQDLKTVLTFQLDATEENALKEILQLKPILLEIINGKN